MIFDADARPWFMFALPAATVYVPAANEAAARAVLAATAYKDAPVDAWPLDATRYTSRELLAASLLRRRAP